MGFGTVGGLDILGQEGSRRIEHHVLAQLGARTFERGFGRVNVGLGGRGGGLRLLQIDRCEGADLAR